ncbi:hypothetical protein [Bordetella sp. N]|uniref:hypothetical protein n=1 Tax=Bordetella sp. N TaxID=1746199 RepID=UPI000708A66F|nr:hypothetical protein [Bordetella sp. N]ALM82030.1 hypothetical protein ASB57_02780 [Bordetella sp. N]
MTTIKIKRALILAAVGLPLHANAAEQECVRDLTAVPVQFQSAIQYEDMQTKANPAVRVLINGKPARMVLDTGSNRHSLWDASLLDEKPGSAVEHQLAIAGMGEVRRVQATVADHHGHALRQDFDFMTDSALAKDGYAGILSPQLLAGKNVTILDFEANCFFTSPSFDSSNANGLDVHRGVAIQNAWYIVGISAELDQSIIPLLVDSGAARTTIQAALVAAKPMGGNSPKTMDIFKAELPDGGQMRLVDLKINGLTFESLPVIPRHTDGGKVMVNLGAVGMDVLKGRIVYYDGAQHQFHLMWHPLRHF